jgi:zinc metalloprotease ZmpB
MPFPINANVRVERDDSGNVQHLEHFQQPFVAAATSAEAAAAAEAGVPAATATDAQALAREYLRQVAPIYGLRESELPDDGDAALSGAAAAPAAAPVGSKLRLTAQKEVLDTTTITYQQTYDGIPVWEAGTSVTIQPAPMRVTASQSSVHRDIVLPAEDALARGDHSPDSMTPDVVKRLLGVPADAPLVINGKPRLVIYQYDPEKRTDPSAQMPAGEMLHGGPPTLALPPLLETIFPGQHYIVTEVLFTLPVAGHGEVNWRAFIEVRTGAVLYLRAFVACATGMIFESDPLTAAGAGAISATPVAGATILNQFRSAVTLNGLNRASPQPLAGEFVRLVDNDSPRIAPPEEADPPADFTYDAPSREFAAVNAYHHCDGLFRRLQEMGFNVASYFDGTSFPVPVDACAFGDDRNARAPGNPMGTGSGGFQFGLAGTPFPAVSIAADVRVVLHEFGHALLWDNVHRPNFGFAHSAGDSLAAILLDPESALRNSPTDRFATFPWLLPNRRHDRDLPGGWAWDGAKYGPFTLIDRAGYIAEQILSTTLFRLYRSMGGDSGDVNERKLAARRAVYLIFRAIGSLGTGPATPTSRPEIFATALMNADIGTRSFEGYVGGALHKVIRWSFEKQGLYQPPGTPRPVTTEGAPPPVDVYIDDGRNGDYQFNATPGAEIWNRQTSDPGAGPADHQEPLSGNTNFLYVQIKNRGFQLAQNVVVRSYSGDPNSSLSWPGDWTPLSTPQLAVSGGIPAGGSVIAGPLTWVPRFAGAESLLIEVSATGDLSNIDANTFFPCAAGPAPTSQLDPFDNNLARRDVNPA